MNEIEDDMNTWKVILCPWMEELVLFKMAILLKAIYKFKI